MTYKGKVDRWIGLMFLAGFCWSVAAAIRHHDYELLAVPTGIVLLLVIFAWPQQYLTAGDALYIRAGLTKRVIPWPEITSVSVNDSSSNDPRFGIVFSRDRVLIQYASRGVVVAPDDQVRFFDDVASHCPQLSKRGMDLVVALNF